MYIDPIISIIIAILLTIGTTGLFKKTIKIVAETVPSDLDIEDIKFNIMTKVPNIIEIHDFHIWVLTDNVNVAVMHVKIDSPDNRKQVLDLITNYLIAYGVFSTTIQIEYLNDYPSIVRNEKNCCAFASQYNNNKMRIFKSNPIYQHLIGCQHISLIESSYEDNYDTSNDNFENNDLNVGLKEYIEP